MKAILEFNLPDDQQDFDLATSGLKFWSVLWDLDQSLRAKTKYASDDYHKKNMMRIKKLEMNFVS